MSGPLKLSAALICTLFTASSAAAFQWQSSELQYQYGRLSAPSFAGGAKAGTHILTLQHASGWGFGDVFFFVDFLDDDSADGFNDGDYYGELYVNFSLGKLTGRDLGFGPVRDLGLIAGINKAGEPKVLKWLPGVRLSWDLPGFTFLNTDFTAYIDDSAGAGEGGAPKESDSWMIDLNWAYAFSIGGHEFSIEGHGEYIDGRRDEFGNQLSHWILLQPQFRYDLGKPLFHQAGHLFIGTEWQYWRNKLGDRETTESVLQALVVVRY